MSQKNTHRISDLGSRWQNFEEECNAVPDGLTQSKLLKGAAHRNSGPVWFQRVSGVLLSSGGPSKRDLNDLMRKERVSMNQEIKAHTSVGSEG
jgi:hypothetical protein